MELGRFQSVVLLIAVLGAALLGAGSRNVVASVGDIAILLALFAFDDSGSRSGAQSIAFGAVSGFCLLTPLFFLANNILGASVPGEGQPWLFVGIWFVATLMMFAIDRFRMGARDNVSLAGAGLAGATPTAILTKPPATSYQPAPIRVQPPTPPIYMEPPPPPPPPVVEPAEPIEATSFANSPVDIDQPPVAAPNVTAIPPGREALIYLNLVGEGLNVLRTVRAENLGRDYYRIADIMPPTEQWEFTPGQVVKCRKKSLSNGKHMVAYEEAPRAQQ